MIIEIQQLSSNIKQTFSVEGDLLASAALGRVHRLQPISVSDSDRILISARYRYPGWTNYIPFRHLFGIESKRRFFCVEKDGRDIGVMYFSCHGFLRSCYRIQLWDGTELSCYPLAKGSFCYVPIYRGNRQIALIETYLTVTNGNYRHKLYLLDEEQALREVLVLFTIYYHNYTFADRFHASVGTTYEKRRTFSKYNRKYSEAWREEHFPNENFFGKVSLFS